MTEADLGRLTPQEFLWMVDGRRDQVILDEKLAWDRAAWSTAHLANYWSKHRVSPRDLLGRPLVYEELAAEVRELRVAAFQMVWEKFQRMRDSGTLPPLEWNREN